MKKCFVVLAVVLFACTGIVLAGDTTPVKLSLFPGVEVPGAQTVHGLDLGLIASSVDEVQGLQASFVYSGASEKMVGIQYGIVNIGKEVSGIQWGFYNQAETMTGVQWGFVNNSTNMKGVQVGFINIIKKGFLPVMVFINANF